MSKRDDRTAERPRAHAPLQAPSLHDPFQIGTVEVPNRLLLAPLAGIGNWFVRLQAKRHGAGMAVSEMVSSHAVHHHNRRTCTEMLRIDSRERALGPVSIQLFGADPEVMRSAAATVAEAGADVIDLNMGCPVPKVCKSGAGAALLADPDRAVALAKAAAAGGLPVTVKLRSGQRPGERTGVDLAERLVAEAGVAAVTLHPRAAAVHHKGEPEYGLVEALAARLDVPLVLTGGLREHAHVREVFSRTGAAAVMLARGALGNPWLFEQLLDRRDGPPSADELFAELRWTVLRAGEHLGAERATSWLRKLYPWYLAHLGLTRAHASTLATRLLQAHTLDDAIAMLTPGSPSQLLSSTSPQPVGLGPNGEDGACGRRDGELQQPRYTAALAALRRRVTPA